MIVRLLRALRDHVLIRRDPVTYARSLGVTVGDNARLLGCERGTFGSEPYLVTLGDHVTVTAGVAFVTHDGGVWVLRDEFPDIDVMGEIVIGDNCFIGLRAIILPGVNIGRNCVIGAGAVVNRNIPDNSIAVGVPARVVSSLAEYRKKSLGRALHVRNLPVAEKRSHVEEWLATQRQPAERDAPPSG